MDGAKLLYAFGYGFPVVAFVLACGLIGFRSKGWRGLVIASAVPTALLCFGRAYNFAKLASAPSEPTQSDALIALVTALVPVIVCFVALHEAEDTLLEEAQHRKWPVAIITSAALIACLWLSLAAVSWFYHRLFPFDELMYALACWAVAAGALSVSVIESQKSASPVTGSVTTQPGETSHKTPASPDNPSDRIKPDSVQRPKDPKASSRWNIIRPDKP